MVKIVVKKIFFKILVFFFFSSYLAANYSPAWAFNNKIGIHILEPHDLNKAAQLVNSSGGDWGYATIVIREDDLDHGKWQKFFDDCRQQHLIPIVRLATRMLPSGFWAKPQLNELAKWPQFLNSLNWPVKQQIVIIFNEPNHSQEWGGEINPQEYALVLNQMINLLKAVNENFFILPAGLDQAASRTKNTLDEVSFLQAMAKTVPGIFDKLDGWSSHSYPNHGFVGLPVDKGKATIQGYEWELAILKQLGLKKELPVYITETGWPHQEGVSPNSQFYQSEKVALFLEKAFKVWQENDQVQAITPFVLNYPLPPFDHFSWLRDDKTHYSQFDQVLGISKSKAEPEQVQNYQVVKVNLIDILPTNYSYSGEIVIKNTGQWIMGERENFLLEPEQTEPKLQISELKLPQGKFVLPGEETALNFTLKTGSQSAEYHLKLGNNEYKIYVFKPWDLFQRITSFFSQVKRAPREQPW
ncbi:hypothetical protein COU96_01745 [Candidatus Shapirobacteria bacterium CG10_big_fil_rev_8_21_14_0_10_38_14]|uniref:Asl1-like glycosyl hydrolase catalytic domain-containing protein n=1 Tax=Candidatus Shapirobacteria bacterium CG10_big_fil_rev_8_21_14_0_10_38_14 TaxID=1974483 RepID=A0A2M8L5E8_9BACT|nr:MAG: hypothetical protein COU96_01745 [Candidatus Shapirobacteria bacterium CG10_big_fil_rev_8_21_14_0_10_38_14]